MKSTAKFRLSALPLASFCLSLGLLATPSQAAAQRPLPASLNQGGLHIPFVPNAGQVDRRVAFSAATFAGTAYVTHAGELVYSLPTTQGGRGWTLVESFVSGNPNPQGAQRGLTRVSYMQGNDNPYAQPLDTFDAVTLGEVWSGVRVDLRSAGRNVEKIFTVAPGVSPGRIRLEMRGAEGLARAADGSLRVRTGNGPVAFAAPFAYQQVGSQRRAVAVRYVVEGRRYGFRLGPYDRSRPLVIDPIIQSTYLGSASNSTSIDEAIQDMAVRTATGDVYVVGTSQTANFPGTSGGQAFGGGNSDVVVARLAADLRSVLQATFIGGSSTDEGRGLFLTASDVYVTGFTASSNFPATPGSAQATSPNTTTAHGFIARLPLALTSLTAVTYIGGTSAQQTQLNAVLLHPNGDVYACGFTASNTIPSTTGGAVSAAPLSGNFGVYVRLNAALSAYVQSSYFPQNTNCRSMAVLPGSGEIVAAGSGSGAPPNLTGSAFPSTGGTTRGWLTRFNAALTQIPLSSFVVGAGAAATVRVHPTNGDIYVVGTGQQNSSAFPPGATTTGAQGACAGGFDCAFVFRFNTTLTAVPNGSFYGNPTVASITLRSNNHMVIDPASGDVFIGADAGRSMPNLTGSFGPTIVSSSGNDGIVVRFSADLTQIRRASYVGGNDGTTSVYALAVHPGNTDLYLGGRSSTASLAGASGGAQATNAGAQDGFVMRATADLSGGGTPGVLQFSAASVSRAENGGTATITVTRSNGSSGAVSVQYATSNGTATAGSDYTSASGTLNWADGDTANKTFDVALTDDTAVESSETVLLTLSNPAGGATLGSQSTSTLTITDNDVAPTNPGIAVSATSLDFGARDIGSASATQTLTVSSNGTAALVIGTIARAGANGGDFTISTDGCSGQSLAPGANCTLQLSFTPSAAGARSATLTVPSNAAGSPASIALTGSGNAPPPPAQSGDRVPNGGGGSFDLALLGLLALGLLARLRLRPQRRTLRDVPAPALAAGILMLGLAPAARADWYAGVEALHSTASNNSGIGRLSVPDSTRSVLQDNGSGFGGFVGFQFDEHFALELGYRDLGNSRFRDVLPGGTPVTLDIRVAASEFHLLGALQWRIGSRAEFGLRAGLTNARQRLDASNGRRSINESTQPMIGASASLDFAGGWQARLAVDHLKTDSFSPAAGFQQELQRGSLDVVSLGLRRRF